VERWFIPQMIYEYGERRWNDIDRGNRRTPRKTYPSATLSTTNSTWIDPGANPGLFRRYKQFYNPFYSANILFEYEEAGT
jgi:hypothetical protein